MSIVYTADVFCDGDGCQQWTNGVTGPKPPAATDARAQAQSKHGGDYYHYKRKDYCPRCWCKTMQKPRTECGCPDCGSSLIEYHGE